MRYKLLPLLLTLGATPDRPLAPPRCTEDERLTIRDGTLRCVSPLLGAFVAVPPCPDGFLTNVGEADPRKLYCQKRTPLDLDAYAALEARTTAVLDRARALSTTAAGAPVFVGVTTVATSGRIQRTGSPPGLLAAHALCADQYPGARMCTGYDIATSAMLGVIGPVRNVPKSWVYHPAWKAPLGPAQERESGLADNCAGYSYDKDDRGWSGVAAATGILATVYWGLRLYNGAAALCSTPLPIACCRRAAGGQP